MEDDIDKEPYNFILYLIL